MSALAKTVHAPALSFSPRRNAEAPFDGSRTGTDIVLRSSDSVEFHTHKTILAVASPTFSDMFSFSYPSPLSPDSRSSSTISDEIPVIPFTEDAHTLGLFLRMIYPIDAPDVVELADIHALLEISRKFNVRAVRAVGNCGLLKALPNSNAVAVYALAMTYGLHEVAALAAVACLRLPLSALDTPEIDLLSGDQYQRLLQFYLASWEAVSVVTTRRVADWFHPVMHYIVLGRVHCACWRADGTRTFWARRDVWAFLGQVRYAFRQRGMDALDIEVDEEVRHCHQCDYPNRDEARGYWEEFVAMFRAQVEKELAKIPPPNFF